MKRKISAAIITKDEESNIERCLNSLDWVDEIVVVDSGSTDRTLDICKRYKCRIVKTDWLGFGRTKRLSVNSVLNDWVLSIDADEEVTPELAREIQETLSGETVKDGYKIRWCSFYLRKWVRHGGWERKYKLKLFNRTKGNYTDDVLHETVKLVGDVGMLKNPLMHHTYPDLATVVRKAWSDADAAVPVLRQSGVRPSVLRAYSHALWVFLKTYIFNAGFLDGKIGLILATDRAHAVYLKYLRYWEKSAEGEQ
jgi:glycosyltransferase involved in cell wall biosynthesis